MSYISRPVVAYVSGVDGTAVADTTLYTVPTGCKLHIENVYFHLTAVDTLTVAPVVSVGANVTFDDWVASTTLTFLTAAGTEVGLATYLPDQPRGVFNAGDVIKASITTGATAVTFTLTIILKGYLI